MQAHIFSGREIPLFGRMEENFSTPQSVALLMPAKAQKLSSILRRQSAFDVNRNVQHFRQERAFLYVANPFLVPGRRNVTMVRENSVFAFANRPLGRASCRERVCRYGKF